MAIILKSEAQQHEMGAGIHRAHYIDKETGAGCVSLGAMTLEAGASLTMHSHLVEDAMYVVSGCGTVVIENERFDVEAGTAILVPAGVKHCIRNDGTEPFTVVYTYPSVCVERFFEA